MIFPNSSQRNMNFGEIKEMSKTNELPAKKKITSELLHQILGHRPTSSLLAGDTAIFGKMQSL